MAQSPDFSVFPSILNETELSQKSLVSCGLEGTDIVTCSMIQDGAVKLPKLDIAVVAAAWVQSTPRPSTPTENNIVVEKSKYLKITSRGDSTDPSLIQGRYRAIFVDENGNAAPRENCFYQVAINVIHDVGSTARDDYGAWVRLSVCEPGFFEYDILLNDDGTGTEDYRNAYHSIIVTDF